MRWHLNSTTRLDIVKTCLNLRGIFLVYLLISQIFCLLSN